MKNTSYKFRYYLAMVAFILTLVNLFVRILLYGRAEFVDIVLVICGVGVFALMKTLYDQEKKKKMR